MRYVVLTLLWLTVLGVQEGKAQQFPAKPIRIVAPFAPGGALDLIARGIASKLSDSFGQSVIVENRAGASGVIGTEAVAHSSPDGYTLLLGATTTHGINPALDPKLPYDPSKDFTPISLVATIPHVLVTNPMTGIHSVQELVQAGKSGKALNYGSAGNGSPHHLAVELFRSMSGIEVVHVPYKGSGPALIDLMAGNIQFMSVEYAAAAPYLQNGKLRALAIATAKRVPGIDLPTVAEEGYPGFEVTSWYAIYGPAGMPEAIVVKLSNQIGKAIRSPDLSERLNTLFATPIGSSPEELAAFTRAEVARWSRVAKEANIKLE